MGIVQQIRKKVMRAVTDSGPTEPNQVKPEAINNLFLLQKCKILFCLIILFELSVEASSITIGVPYFVT